MSAGGKYTIMLVLLHTTLYIKSIHPPAGTGNWYTDLSDTIWRVDEVDSPMYRVEEEYNTACRLSLALPPQCWHFRMTKYLHSLHHFKLICKLYLYYFIVTSL